MILVPASPSQRTFTYVVCHCIKLCVIVWSGKASEVKQQPAALGGISRATGPHSSSLLEVPPSPHLQVPPSQHGRAAAWAAGDRRGGVGRRVGGGVGRRGPRRRARERYAPQQGYGGQDGGGGGVAAVSADGRSSPAALPCRSPLPVAAAHCWFTNFLGVQLLRAAAGFDPAANPPPGGWAGLQATLQQILEELEEGREGQQQQQAVLVQMQATLQQVLAAAQQQQATLVQLQAGLQQMQEGLQQMQEGQQQMLVRQANDRRRWHNRKAQQAFRQASFQVALEPLCKEQPPPAGAKGAAALGALPPAGTFPQTWLAGSLVGARGGVARAAACKRACFQAAQSTPSGRDCRPLTPCSSPMRS